MIRFLLVSVLTLSLSANVAVTGDTYKKISNEKIEVIYADEYEGLASKVLEYESGILKTYEKSFGFSLDDTQYVGILSSSNQIANAYSSQLPFNIQMNFCAGAMGVDYFAGTSWIKTLLLHETTHNFQLNPKKNRLSYYAHKVLKNSLFTTLLFAPIFPIPNVAESSFILEGNAVLNESWHNNGGRLYNGALLAMALTQARAGYITPERTYNNHLYFPYDTHNYIVGGFFQLYLAELYGIDKVNSYFYNFSGQWIPLFTNSVFEETFGKNFEESLQGYNAWLLKRHSGFVPSQGKVLFRSKSSKKLNSDDENIYILTSDMLSQPTLVQVDKKSKKITKTKTNHKMGKLFKTEGKYYSLASAHTRVDEISVGLFDEEGHFLEGSGSQAMQSVSADGKKVYFDIPSSFDEPQMYVDGKFYAKVNSSVFTYHDRHYYFVQSGKTRTLYENKKALFSFEGWYGFVCDINDEGVYFIANTKHGSGLYRYHDSLLERMSVADDIIDARLIDKEHALIASIGAEGINFQEITLLGVPSKVEEVKYFFEDDARFGKLRFVEKASKSQRYNPLTNMHYSSLSQSVSSAGKDINFDISANFTDALSQNSVKIFTTKSGEDVIAGVGYDSSAYRLNFGASLFGVLAHDKNESSRGFGTYMYLKYPLMHTTYEKMNLKLSYLLAGKRDEKEPLTLSLNYTNHKQYGQSMYLNSANDVQLSLGLDREDRALGLKYHFSHALGSQFYAGFDFRVAKADISKRGNKRGIKVQQYGNRFADALNFEMPSLSDDIYVQEILNGELSLKKVFDLDAYFFSFPASLRREAIYAKYNYYKMQFLSDRRKDFHEFTLGVTADMLYFNRLPIPISMEYIINEELENANNFRVLFDLSF